MAVRTRSAALFGIDAVHIDVETEIISALKRFVILGLADSVLKEARERVRCAIENTGFAFPYRELVVSLSPASLPKCGSGMDLAIAMGILAAEGHVDPAALRRLILVGELALDGSIKAVPGALAAAALCARIHHCSLVLAAESAPMAALVSGARVLGARSLLELVSYLRGSLNLPAAFPFEPPAPCRDHEGFGDVVGQGAARRAIEIAAAGGHNLFMIGPPGAGKSMLARRIPSVMPPLEREEILELSRVYAALRQVPASQESKAAEPDILVTRRPFRSPHHCTSTAGLVGGGQVPVPGEVSLAHKGILFLDEFLEMRRESVEALREPLEAKQISICRAKMRMRFPADFTLVAAANPCPCGKRGNGGSLDQGCRCSPMQLQRYFGRLSGPMLDRIDLGVWIPPVPLQEFGCEQEDPTAEMSERIRNARKVQGERYCKPGLLNCRMGTADLRRWCSLDGATRRLMEDASRKLSLSARGYTKVMRISRTIADLEGSAEIKQEHLAEALSYRLKQDPR